MKLENINYQGPDYEMDEELEPQLPDNLVSLLKQINGFIQFGGGLHVRGACREPEWHSISAAMKGSDAIHEKFEEVETTDVPFAQDCVADQYLLRDGIVHKLFSETGEVKSLDLGLGAFLSAASNDPVEFLGLHPLLQLHEEDKQLEPGQVIHVYPPFCTEESKNGVSLTPVSWQEALGFLSDLAKKIRLVGTGNKIEFRVAEHKD